MSNNSSNSNNNNNNKINNKQKLELLWIGKDNDEFQISNIESRILEENKELSNCTDDVNTENMLIHGDNLLALKALLPEFKGKVKCIYIDPPYNTGNAFEHYDDNLEHSTWLSLMKPRLELLKMLLREDGVIFISIDNREFAYLKILVDEVFGRCNYVGEFVWQKKRAGGNDSKYIAIEHEYIISFVKNNNVFSNWSVNYDDKYLKRYSEVDEKGRYFWDTLARPGLRNPIVYDIKAPDGSIISGEWIRSKKRFDRDYANGEIKLTKKKNGYWSVQFKQYIGNGKKPRSILNDIAINSDAKNEMIELFKNAKFFSYPKPENLIKYLIESVTQPNDLVLDSFLGSGTTCAVAHKMGRKYIGIEMGEHAYTHCKVRLDKVIDASDQGGISKSVDWKGGGAYKFYELAPSFIIKDEFGIYIIDPYYNDVKLIKAMCKLMKFAFNPSKTEYWKHGVSNVKNYIYITTQLITKDTIFRIFSRLKDDETLMVCPKSFEKEAEEVSNRIKIKKIPDSVLKFCHFGKMEYLLPVKEEILIEDENLELDDED